MTVVKAFMSGIMMYAVIAGMVAVSNGVTQAATGTTLTGYLSQTWGRINPLGE
tara:strand:+ start:119 stop:277 length:159 start_codon:yes stop_codon:yes gene_type:complete